MAENELSRARIDAGREFLKALNDLGLNPEGLFWARDATIEEDVLVLVTAMFDFVGPLEVYKKLLKAYNASATPKSISPFIIRIHSPLEDVGHLLKHFEDLYRSNIIEMRPTLEDGSYGPIVTLNLFGDVAGYLKDNNPNFYLTSLGIDGTDMSLYVTGLYKLDLTRKTKVQKRNEWRSFSEHVAALAA